MKRVRQPPKRGHEGLEGPSAAEPQPNVIAVPDVIAVGRIKTRTKSGGHEGKRGARRDSGGTAYLV
jgi:hypothetical protein